MQTTVRSLTAWHEEAEVRDQSVVTALHYHQSGVIWGLMGQDLTTRCQWACASRHESEIICD